MFFLVFICFVSLTSGNLLCLYNGYYYKPSNKCYAFHPIPSNWFDAQKSCSNLNGSLASINSQGLNNFLTTYDLLVGFFCIGLKWNDTVSQWKRSDGSSLDYTNWLPSKPFFQKLKKEHL